MEGCLLLHRMNLATKSNEWMIFRVSVFPLSPSWGQDKGPAQCFRWPGISDMTNMKAFKM